MKPSQFKPDFERLRRVREADVGTIEELAKIAGLDPARDFRFADLRGVDWRGTDKSKFDLTGSWTEAEEEPDKPSWVSAAGNDKYGKWAEFTIEGVTSRLRWIPPGRFLMGSPEDEEGRFPDEGPLHAVTFAQGYWLMDTTVTQALYEAVTGENPSEFKDPKRPVETVSWNDAKAFCDTANGLLPGLALRLPSEAEWEYACRAGMTTAYSFGDEFDPELANTEESGRDETVPVKSLPPNGWGLYEMHGNVLELCEDDYHPAMIMNTPEDGLAWVDSYERGPSRVLRGGSWYDVAKSARSAYRYRYGPGARSDGVGFRCARSAD